MSDLLLQVAISNIAIAGTLALLAWALQHTGRFPRAAHLLWLVVLVKLIAPAFVTVPVFELPTAETSLPVTNLDGIELAALSAVEPALASESASVSLGTILLWIWGLGSALALAVSLVRVVRFHRLLGAASAPAGDAVQRVARDIGARLRLRRTPTIYATSARVSPLVWWVGGRTRIVIPDELTRDMKAEELEWVIAHELCHVKRRDPMVRWLEWLAVVVCWWNPIAWWARHNLRINEEVCCDALVLETLNPNPRTYASSLLTVVEFLSTPAMRAPAVASAMSGGSLERRFKMIVSAKSLTRAPRWMRALALLLVVAVLPLGIAQAGDGEKAKKAPPTEEQMGKVKEELWAAMKAGRITEEEAKERWHAYVREVKGSKKAHARHEAGRGERIFHQLQERGFTEQQAKTSVGAIERIVHEMKKEGEAYEMNAELRNHLVTKLDLADAQIDTLEEIAQRICADIKRREAKERELKKEMTAVKKKLWDRVKAGEITEEEAEAKWKAYLEFVHGMLGGKKHRTHEQEIHEKIEHVKRRIAEAVEAGEITEEEGKRKLEEFMKELHAHQQRMREKKAREDREGTALGPAKEQKAEVWAELEEAVKAGKLTEEQAKERFEHWLRSFRKK